MTDIQVRSAVMYLNVDQLHFDVMALVDGTDSVTDDEIEIPALVLTSESVVVLT